MRKILLLLFAVGLVSIYGFTRKSLNNTFPGNSEPEKEQITGGDLFLKNCAACHGVNRQGNPPAFPSLVSVDERMNKEQVLEKLKSGGEIMPSFAHLSASERKAITGFLFGETIKAEEITEILPVDHGRDLFVANCTRCHKANPEDPQPAGQKNWGMRPAVLGGVNKRFEQEKFKRILNTGPCYMPSFDFLKDSDKEDIYAYLSTMEGDPDVNSFYARGRGRGMRGNCRRY